MTARTFQGFLQVPAKAQEGNPRVYQGFLQVIASRQPPFANAKAYQAFIQVIGRNYKISAEAIPQQETVRVGVHNAYDLLTMGSMNED